MTEKDVLPAVWLGEREPLFLSVFCFFPEENKKLVVVVVAVRKLLSKISCLRLDVLWFDGW